VILFRAAVPMPPSLNNAFVNVAGKGRVRSKAYRAWAEVAGWMVKARMNGAVNGPVTVSIDICPSTRRAYDLDNRAKPCLDLLVSCGVIPDDSNKIIKALTIREVAEGPECVISLEAA
jgi:Holliday junction resolvase RusA-like endonuclease